MLWLRACSDEVRSDMPSRGACSAARRFVSAPGQLAAPFEPAGIEAVAKDGVDGADRQLAAAFRIDEPGRLEIGDHLAERGAAGLRPSITALPRSRSRRRIA